MTSDLAQMRDRDRQYVWHPWSPVAADRTELMISSGEKYRVRDVEGNEYIDASSLNSICGYGHPELIAAVNRQLLRLHGLDISVASHELAGLLAERLASYLPTNLNRTLFVNSGSEGMEAAVLIASNYWAQVGEARSRVVTLTDGYHGSTTTSRSLSGLPRVGHPFQAPLPVTHVDLPASPREMRRPESLRLLLSAFERALLADPNDPPMAVVVEPFLNVGGGIVLPEGFLRGLRELCDSTGTLLVLDEVFTAYGRTGKMFAFQRENAAPDILVTSKGLGGGYMPIAAVTVQQRVYDSFASEPVIGGLRYGHTTSGHAAACAAGLATLDVLDKENLVDQAERFGTGLLDRFAPLAGTGDVLDVRGLGLVTVLELSSVEACNRLLRRARDNGLLLRQHGPVAMSVPPLTIDDEGVDALADRLERALGTDS
ncbi:aspartate aminotransferase family protein [Streptomyces sp. NPDC094034]|uniref:aminotransferase family protein n=1 Tax=Streptomyces sp. NPDC094034 TaxID=3155309 RepID=UPI00332379AF